MKNPFAEKSEPAGRKVVHHIEVHPQMGGGWSIQAHHASAHPPMVKHFKAAQAGKAAAHLMAACGMPGASEEAGESEHDGE